MNIKEVILAVCETLIKIAIAVVVVMFIYRGSLIAYEYGYRIFEEPAMAEEGEGRDVVVTIQEGMSAKEMGELLYMKGLIRDEKLFQIQYFLSEFKEDLLPGTFTLNTSLQVEEMLEVMTKEPVTEDTAS